jgi:C4-dicarboxylate-specific signal transduction histidine kinase
MSTTGSKLAPSSVVATTAKGRSPLAHLLHALNQPLTGLQCSLELAAASPRTADQYVRTLREALDLTGRMRILVEAIRELADNEDDSQHVEAFQLDALVCDTVDGLFPVAETIGVRLTLLGQSSLRVRADRRRFATLLFRWLESALSLAHTGSELQIVTSSEPARTCIAVSWQPGPAPDHSPFSRQELGLLIAQAGWERAGAEWTLTRPETPEETAQSCTVRLSLPPCFAAR